MAGLVYTVPMGGRVLLTDDDQFTLIAHERALAAAGMDVVSVGDGDAAIARLGDSFDCIVSDIHMPGLDGLQLLRRVRERDLDVPVILVTGEPSLETAIRALEYGALRYLTKPVAAADLVGTVREAVRLCALARVKRDALAITGNFPILAGDRAGMEATLASALDSLWVAFQPIVHARGQRILGYEALLRSKEAALPDPGAVLETAERLGRLHTLGRTVRDRVATTIDSAPVEPCFFVNLHPEDLLDEDLSDANSLLARHATRVVLEITERAPLDRVGDLRERIARLRELGFQLAIDDFGAGYAGLSAFTNIEPEYVKIDMSLVRGIGTSAVKRRVVSRTTELAHDLGMQVVAEGIQTAEERAVVTELGCDFLQGYLFAMPGRPFPDVSW
jgi:EAL domain-containing protein (putative c-di-GMP-specific phosphodiesterase class I)/ActR/RegA family two-component response regulator